MALLLLLICHTVASSQPPLSISRTLVSRRAGRNRRRNGSNGSLTRPVSYKYQGLEFQDPDAYDEENWYNDKSYRLWKVDFAPRSPGKYSLTSRLVMANVFIYGLQVFFPSITKMGVKVSEKVLAGKELYRLFTAQFLHGGLTHLGTNIYSLQAVGHDVERYFGGGRYLATYLASGVVANVVSAIKTPNPSLGASGAVFGVIGGYLVFLNRNSGIFGRRGEYMAGAVSRTIMFNLILGAMSPMVDNWSHLGGAIGGAAMSYYFGPRLFIAELPNGGRTIVDKPILRLPRSLESIPERVGDRFRSMKRRMQVETFKAEHKADRPWRKAKPRRDYRRRQSAPSKSVRPDL